MQRHRSLNLIRRCRRPITDQHCSSPSSFNPSVHSNRLFHSFFHQSSTATLPVTATSNELRCSRRKCTDACRRHRLEGEIEFRTVLVPATTMQCCSVPRLSGPAAARRRRLRRNFSANWAVADRPLRATAAGPGGRSARERQRSEVSRGRLSSSGRAQSPSAPTSTTTAASAAAVATEHRSV